MLATRIIFIGLCFSTGSQGMFTPLEIDNHPCQPENLKVNTYTLLRGKMSWQPLGQVDK